MTTRRPVKRLFYVRSFAVLLAGLAALSSCATDQSRRQATGWTELGNAWAELGRWDKAGDAWSRAIDLDPGQGVASYNLSRALAEAGKYDEAIARSDEYLASDPDNAAVMSIKAYALHQAGRDDEAIVVYERVVVLNGGDSASVFNLAVLLDSAGRRAEALARYDDILAVRPDDPAASWRKGLLLLAEGQGEAALPFLERYAAANPGSLDAQRTLAAARERAGRFADAMDSYTAIVAKAPDDSAALFALARLKLTVAADEAGGLESLKSALAKGFKDEARAQELLAFPGLVATEAVRAILAEAGLLAGQPGASPVQAP